MTETKASEKMGVSGMVISDEAVDLGQKDTLALQDEARALQACKVGREMWVYVIKLRLLQILNFSEITVSHCLTSPWGVPCWLLVSVSGSLVIVQQTEMNVFSSSKWLALRLWACTLTSLDRILTSEKSVCTHCLWSVLVWPIHLIHVSQWVCCQHAIWLTCNYF